MNFTKDDRINWTRYNNKIGKTITSQGEVIRCIKNQKPGAEKVMAILNENFYEKILPVSRIEKIKEHNV